MKVRIELLALKIGLNVDLKNIVQGILVGS